MENTGTRFTVRDLPLPAKLVVTVFLMAVGLGYCWAMMQLHFKHATKGNLLPGGSDVVERFSGQSPPWEKQEEPQPKPEEKKDADNKAAPAKLVAGAKIKSIIDARCTLCHAPDEEKAEIPFHDWPGIAKYLEPAPDKGAFYKVIRKDDESNFNKDNMTQAFTKKSKETVDGEERVEWKQQIKKRPEAELRSEREIERTALILWLEAGAPKEAYDKDAFPLPEGMGPKLTKRFQTEAPELPKLGANEAPAPKKKKNPKDRQLSIENLTQSTHAHLLTFAVLWAATGLVFAFTSYSTFLRCIVSPIVLIAQVADIGCWWLARLPDVGPYFAVAIMGTGAVVGLGLGAQIVLSLFNMYGGKGKFVLLVLFVVGAAGGGIVYTKYIAPQIAEEKQAG